MKLTTSTIFVLLTSLGLTASSYAQTPAPTCNAAVQEKKLAGAAKAAFLKKCEREATEKCEAAAAERKLVGAAKSSNIKKCLKDTVGE